MRVFLSNEDLQPAINWSTLGPPLARGLEKGADFSVLRPRPYRRPSSLGPSIDAWRKVRSASTVLWMQLSARPEREIAAAALLARRAHKAAYVIDAWPYVLERAELATRLMGVDTCFVAFREAHEILSERYPRRRFVHLPFGVDTDVFKLRDVPKDIFCFWMGRRHEPLHAALERYCHNRGLRYVTSTGGRIQDPDELGKLVSRSQYFVVTSPDVDHPDRSGGFSPFVMRYLEGAAAGARLLGTVPRSGEYGDLLPKSAILEVSSDGSDLERRLDEDRREVDATIANEEVAKFVMSRHSWAARAREIGSQVP